MRCLNKETYYKTNIDMDNVKTFLSRIANDFSLYESNRIFGADLGAHIWDRYARNRRDVTALFLGIDSDCQRKLYDWAVSGQ